MSESRDLTPTTGPGMGSRSGKDARTEKVLQAIRRPRAWSGHDIPDHVERAPSYGTNADDFDPNARLPPMALPGFGGKRYDDCGDDLEHFCKSCGHTKEIGRTCATSSCTRCASTWCRNRAATNVGKLWALKKMLTVSEGRKQHLHHVVFSPPKDWQIDAGDPLNRTFSVIKEILREMQAQGLVAYHPWSGKEGDDIGKWKDRLFSGREWEDDVRDELQLRPHFHAVVVSDFIKGGQLTKRVEEETGWLIKRITGKGSKESIAGQNDEEVMASAAKAVTYTVSHTGLKRTEAGNLSAQYRLVGEDADKVEVYDDVQQMADRITREVAHTTLGIPSAQTMCEAQVSRVPDREASAMDALESVTALEGDGAGSGSDTLELDAGGEHGHVEPCRGGLERIHKAPQYLESEEWRNIAAHLEELQAAYEMWKAEEGGGG